MSPQQPRPTLFPYTTLFRSVEPELPAGQERLRRDLAFLRELEGEQRSDLRLREVPHERLRRHGLLELTHAKIFEGRHRIDHRSEEHTSELQSPYDLVCRLLL